MDNMDQEDIMKADCISCGRELLRIPFENRQVENHIVISGV